MAKVTQSAEMVIRSAAVALSQYHAGQAIAHSATMRARGHYYVAERDASGKPIERFRAQAWQAVHRTIDQSEPVGSPERESVVASPWLATMTEAEDWLAKRGLLIAGAYWRSGARDE